MFATKLDNYMPDYDNDEPITILNPHFAFKSYIPSVYQSEDAPTLTLTNSLIDFGNLDDQTDNEVEFCVENQGIFPIEIYSSILPKGFSWNGFNRRLDPETSFCSAFTANAQLIELNEIDFHFSLSHNGDNSPTFVHVYGNIMNDNDSDGILNSDDPDDDNDGVDDFEDAFPFDASETSDSDQDGIGNNTDNDDDNDGILDISDAFPFDPSENADNDQDGIGNNSDDDDDNDGVLDSSDAFPFDSYENADNDQDGIGDNADNDDDNDGVLDSFDAFPKDPSESSDADQDGIGDNADLDDNNDGIIDGPTYELEPNDSISQGIVVGQTIIGTMASGSDLDWYSLLVESPGSLTIEFQTELSDHLGFDIEIFDSEFNLLASKSCATGCVNSPDELIAGISEAGTYFVKIKSMSSSSPPDGTYTLTTSFSSDLNNYEIEPNDSISQGIVVGQTIIGTMASGSDLDWYSLLVESPGSLTIEFQTELSDHLGFDIEIFDSEFNLLASKSCATGCVNSPDELIAGISEAGTYFVKIKSMSSSSPPDGTYTLTTSFSSDLNNYEIEPNDSISQGIVVGQTIIGTMASGSDLDWYSLLVESPGSLTIEFQTELSDHLGFDIEIFDSEFNLLASKSCATGCVNSPDELIAGISEAGTYFVKIKSMSSSSPPDGTYTLTTSFSSDLNNYEIEPNDSISQGIVVGQTIIGTMASGSDLDWYSLLVESPGSLTIEFQTELSDHLGFDIEIFDSEFNLLASKSCATGCVNSPDELIAGISEAGTYFVKIKSMSSSSPPDGTYTLTTSFASDQAAVDNSPPVITLNGSNSIVLNQFDEYTEFGATAIDDVDGEIQIETIGSVNTM